MSSPSSLTSAGTSVSVPVASSAKRRLQFDQDFNEPSSNARIQSKCLRLISESKMVGSAFHPHGFLKHAEIFRDGLSPSRPSAATPTQLSILRKPERTDHSAARVLPREYQLNLPHTSPKQPSLQSTPVKLTPNLPSPNSAPKPTPLVLNAAAIQLIRELEQQQPYVFDAWNVDWVLAKGPECFSRSCHKKPYNLSPKLKKAASSARRVDSENSHQSSPGVARTPTKNNACYAACGDGLSTPLKRARSIAAY